MFRLANNVERRLVALLLRHTSRPQRRTLKWVPLAYRGAKKPDPPEQAASRAVKRARQEQAAAEDRQQVTERRLAALHRDVVRIAQDYRGHFSTEPLVLARRPSVFIDYRDEQERQRAILRSIGRQIREIFTEIHRSDGFVQWKQLQATEDLFRGLCRALQDLVRTCTQLRQLGDDSDAEIYLDLAELALGTLVKLGSDRSLLVESLRTWSEPALRSDGTRLSSVSSFFGSLFGGQSASKSEVPVDIGPLAHEDAEWGATQDLFAAVVQAIAAGVETEADGPPMVGTDISESQREMYEAASRRMVGLLDVMPSDWLPNADVMKQILEMLCRVGTLESARSCHMAFKRHPNNQHRLRFSLVLQAYLEATKYEKSHSKRLLAVEEALEALHQEWNENLPKHRVERIVHCSIVLNCMCVAERSISVPEVCELADRLVKRTLGTSAYDSLREELLSDKPKVDAQTVPLVNCLAQIYVSSDDASRMESARRMVSYIMHDDREGVGRFNVYPMVDTFNAVIRSFVVDFEGETQRADDDGKERDKSLRYVDGLLSYMLSRRDQGYWPNEETFESIFGLLLAINPKDIGSRADRLLSHMEARRCFPENDPFPITISAYHRALRCWLEAAKNPFVSNAPRSALKLLDRLEVQSLPFLLSDPETQVASVAPLYDISLRPIRKTYKLVHRICVQTGNEKDYEAAAEVALEVYRRMVARCLPLGKADANALARCVARLPASSAMRIMAESELRVLDDMEGDDSAFVGA